MKFEKVFKIGHSLYRSNHKILAHVIQGFIRLRFNCDIPVQTEIAPDAYFCHNAFGVVINPAAKLGGGTTIQHCVTIGEVDSHDAPVIGKNVFIGARAMILGDIIIGDNVKIGAGAVVLRNVPHNCTAVGVPARIIGESGVHIN